MLKIRLSRTGKKNQPHYRIVVTERRSKRDGGIVANLGHYIPYTNPAVVRLEVNEYDQWLGKGAQATPVVSYLRSQTKDNKEVEITKDLKPKNNKHRVKAAEEAAAAKEASAPKQETPAKEEVADKKEAEPAAE